MVIPESSGLFLILLSELTRSCRIPTWRQHNLRVQIPQVEVKVYILAWENDKEPALCFIFPRPCKMSLRRPFHLSATLPPSISNYSVISTASSGLREFASVSWKETRPLQVANVCLLTHGQGTYKLTCKVYWASSLPAFLLHSTVSHVLQSSHVFIP